MNCLLNRLHQKTKSFPTQHPRGYPSSQRQRITSMKRNWWFLTFTCPIGAGTTLWITMALWFLRISSLVCRFGRPVGSLCNREFIHFVMFSQKEFLLKHFLFSIDIFHHRDVKISQFLLEVFKTCIPDNLNISIVYHIPYAPLCLNEEIDNKMGLWNGLVQIQRITWVCVKDQYIIDHPPSSSGYVSRAACWP